MAGALDLLSLLGGVSSTKEAVSAFSGKTSASEDQITQALLQALPSMLGKMQTNAKTKDGADSLLKALDQHDLSDADIVKLIKTADMEDGVKILNHIYGDEKKTEAAQKEVAAKTGIDAAKIAKIMAVAAPAVLTMLAKTNKKTNKTQAVSNSDGLADLLGGVMSLAGGGSKGGLDIGSLLGAALGGGSKKDAGLDLGDILGALMK
ncbi:MAG: DUF937 domain-containing protein [Firmicutes bacterium]|nr:DUF937 domain-containing protein [Bacillota bacterium]MBQ4466924.1 DUF937 domain-containing protein [Bacillota bacterium]MCR4709942.1 DUF937 domain-containing protein [Clostridiales bacterium]